MPLNRSTLLATSRAIAAELKLQCEQSPVRIRIPNRAIECITNGWRAVVGSLGQNNVAIEIWLDRFSGHAERKFYAGLRADRRGDLARVVKRLDQMMPIRTITTDDMVDEPFISLARRLPRSQFNAPILEHHDTSSFFGIYDPTPGEADRVHEPFVASATAFFVDIARSLPRSAAGAEETTIYQAVENRLLVASHLRRERNRYLAEECKRRDSYLCQICDFNFEAYYGPVGRLFAEAHHRVPLSKLSGAVRTCLDDLITVCANCHRMLHRMTGEASDIQELTKAIGKRRAMRKSR